MTIEFYGSPETCQPPTNNNGIMVDHKSSLYISYQFSFLKNFDNNNILPHYVGAGFKPAPTVNTLNAQMLFLKKLNCYYSERKKKVVIARVITRSNLNLGDCFGLSPSQ